MQSINSTDQMYGIVFSKMNAANRELIRVLETCDSFKELHGITFSAATALTYGLYHPTYNADFPLSEKIGSGTASDFFCKMAPNSLRFVKRWQATNQLEPLPGKCSRG